MSNEIDITNEQRLASLAAEIRTIKEQTARVMMQSAVEIGKRLVEAKAAVGHGGWEKWLKENVDYSQRTASNLIAVFQEYGQGQQALFGKEINPQALAKLTYTQAVELLGIKDPDERADFVENHDVAAMSTRELEKAIRERDAAKKEKDAAIAARNDALKQREIIAKDRAIVHESLGNIEKEKAELEEELKKAKKELAAKELEAQAGAGGIVDDKRAQELEASLAVAKGKIKELEIKLDQPMDAVTIIPPETQEELESLRKQVEKLQDIPQPAPDETALENKLKLKLHLAEWQNAFNAAKAVILAETGETRALHIKVLKTAMARTGAIVDEME